MDTNVASNALTTATREIMWNIPYSFKVTMYALFTLSLVIFFQGLYKKIQYVAAGSPWKKLFSHEGLLPKKLRWGQFFETIFLQGKVKRNLKVGIAHALIYYGFIVLWIATDLVAIHYDTPFKVFQGTTYKVISFLADMAGLTMIIGIGMAYYRRYIQKPSYLEATRPKQELFMYVMLLLLVVIGFVIEGFRIYGTGMPIGEKSWAPIGWLLATFFQGLGLTDETSSLIYRSLWFFHMVNTMVFVASLTHTKFFHMLAASFSSLITPPREGAVLKPMDFEDETAETFGLGKVSELNFKNRWDTMICVECGRCTNSCPANQAGKPLDPKKIITKLRDHIDDNKGDDLWGETNVYQNNELDACTTCGACMEECPLNITHVNLIMDLKRYKVLTLGEIPPAAATAVSNIRTNGNPWGITQEDRFKWAEGLEVETITPEKKVDYLYYVGCAGSYDAANQQVVQDTVKLLKKAGVSFAVMGKTEKCNGDPIRRFGDEYSFFEVAIENIANMRQYQFDKVVTHCPHCLHTIGKEYAKFEDGDFTTVHHTELLAQLITDGKLKPEKPVAQEEYTFHDPCYLGRHHGEYNAPRKILESIEGINLKEMAENKDRSLCCGMGGGNMWYELPEGEHLANNRLQHIEETKVEKLATACSYCMINFNSTKNNFQGTENIEIQDVASILLNSMEEK